MKITERQLRRRVEDWQKALAPLGVGHWRLAECSIVDDVAGASGSNAGVNPSGYYDTCWMQYDRKYVENADAQTLDETIIHEWLHVAWRDYQDTIESASTQMSPQAKFLWMDRVDHEAEGVIERLARVLYHFYSRSVLPSSEVNTDSKAGA